MNLNDRRKQYAVNIRKQQVQAYKKQIRKSFYTPNYQIVLAQLLKQFQIEDPQKKFYTKQKYQALLQILQLKFESLVKINFKQHTMFDEKQTTQNSQIQLQKIFFPKQYPINTHISFYQLLASELFSNGLLFEQKIKILQEFVDKFIFRNKYRQIAVNTNYQSILINVFELIIASSKDQSLKKKLLHWVQGTESLTLIFNCLPKNEFLFVLGYANIYTIIQRGLDLPILERNRESVDILQKLLKRADYDDVSSLLKNNVGILVNLLKLIHRNMGGPIINPSGICIILILQTYDDCVFQSARLGVGLISAKLISSQKQQQMKLGLQIFRAITLCALRPLQAFMLSDYQINEAGAWQVMGRSLKVYKNQNLQVRKSFSFIIFNIISNGGYEQIVQIGNKILYQNNQDLLDMLISTIFQQENPLIILNALSNIKTLLYYSYEFAQNPQKNNHIFQRILKSKLEVKISQLSESQNSTLKTDCQQFLNYIHKKKQEQSQ